MRIAIFGGLVLAAASAGATECAFQEPRNLDIDAAGVALLEAKLESADMRFVGDPASSASKCAAAPAPRRRTGSAKSRSISAATATRSR